MDYVAGMPDPEYADPDRYAELAGFSGDYRDLWWNADFLALMAQRWRLGERRTILDVGCGAGHWGSTLLNLAPAEATLTGVDRESIFLEQARARASEKDHASRSEFVVGDAEALPFPDASFDVVGCQTVLIHVADPARVIAEMIRVLRPGGILIAAEPDNLAGNVALLGSSLATPDDDLLAIVELSSTCQRGKRALGEGDDRIGHRLAPLFAEAGLTSLRCHTNDRCMDLIPPYADAAMRATIARELEWADQGVSILCGTESDTHRLHAAGGGDPDQCRRGYAAVQRWLAGFASEARAGRFASSRGFVMYLASGEKPR